jgi:cell division protein FtsZ
MDGFIKSKESEEDYPEEPVAEDESVFRSTIEEAKKTEEKTVKVYEQKPEPAIKIDAPKQEAHQEKMTPEIKTYEQKAEKKDTAKRQYDIDAELEEILSRQRATIKVVGTGGGGNNTINRIKEVGIVGAETIAANTDAQDLLYTSADKKVLIGREITGGLGAGSIPKIGEEAARESERELRDALQGADMVFVTCGMGGGTGTGSAPVIAEIAKKVGALTVGIVTMPFSMEGHRRYENAIVGLEKLEQNVDTLIVIPNDKLLEIAPDLPIQTAFKVADEILTNAVKGIAELVTKAGLVNLDFADIRAVMGKGGVALIGVGESDSDNRAIEAVEKALNNPLLDVDISGANGALINVVGGSDMTLDEARKVVETISSKLDDDARVIWGAQINDDMANTIRAMLIVTGVKSSQIFGKSKRLGEGKKEEMVTELGIEFVD